MKFAITPPLEEDEEVAANNIEKIKKGIKTPNTDHWDMYSALIRAIVEDLVTYGVSIIERKKGTDLKGERAFWLWPVANDAIKIDPDWYSGSGLARFWAKSRDTTEERWEPLEDEDLFFIQRDISSDNIFPPSPLQLAFEDLNEFTNLRDYQRTITRNDNRDGIIYFEDAGEEEVIANREYFESESGSGRRLVVGGKVGFQALSAQRDEEMFLAYMANLVSFIGIYFDLSQRDLGYLQEANYATADIAAQASFQQAILPIAQLIIASLHYKVVDFYYPGYSLSLQDVEPRNEEGEANRATALYEKGLATKNESRSMVGLDAINGGDEFAGQEGGTPPPGAEAPPAPEPEKPEKEERSPKDRKKDEKAKEGEEEE